MLSAQINKAKAFKVTLPVINNIIPLKIMMYNRVLVVCEEEIFEEMFVNV